MQIIIIIITPLYPRLIFIQKLSTIVTRDSSPLMNKLYMRHKQNQTGTACLIDRHSLLISKGNIYCPVVKSVTDINHNKCIWYIVQVQLYMRCVV